LMLQVYYASDNKPKNRELTMKDVPARIVNLMLSKCPSRLFRNAGLSAVLTKALSASVDGDVTPSKQLGAAAGGRFDSGGAVTADSKTGTKGEADMNIGRGTGSSTTIGTSSSTASKMRDVVLVIIDSAPPSRSFGTKENDSRKHTKQRTQSEKDVAEFMKNMLQCASVSLMIRSHGQGMLFRPYPQSSLFVLSADVGFVLLRELGSIVMRSCSFVTNNPKTTNLSAAKDELVRITALGQQPFPSPGGAPVSSSTLKKQLKQIVFELSAVGLSSSSSSGAQTPAGDSAGTGAHSHGHSSASHSGSGSTSSGTAGSGGTAGNVPASSSALMSAGSGQFSLYLHSAPDSKFDMITYSPDSLARILAAGVSL
jgi:hypothetical protein